MDDNIEIEVRFLNAEDGGRQQPPNLKAGTYRPHCRVPPDRTLLVLQPQLRRQKGRTATIVGLFGSKLVLPPPMRPSQDEGGQGSNFPQQAPQQSTNLTDRERQHHQPGLPPFFVLEVGQPVHE